MGCSGSRLGASWSRRFDKVPVGLRVGAVWGPSWAVLGVSWAVVGPSATLLWGPLGRLGGMLKASLPVVDVVIAELASVRSNAWSSKEMGRS
eukprot:1024674-Pyramimonas_sp.AAC.1